MKSYEILVWSLVPILIISIGINIIVIEKYDLLSLSQNHIVSDSSTSDNATNKSSSSVNNRALVFYLVGKAVNEVYQTSADDSVELPTQLIIQPGIYSFSGKNYSLDKEGLYRFLIPGKVNAQRIVYKTNGDLFVLLSAISWIVTHGYSDNEKSIEKLTEKALYSKLLLTCDKISLWAHYILKNLNIESRRVFGMTYDEFNDYNNGHVLIEVYNHFWKKWTVIDLDNNCYFVTGKAKIPLSLIEFSQAVAKNDYSIVYLSDDTRVDVTASIPSNSYSYLFFMEWVNVNIREWYQRVMQVPFISDESDHTHYFMDKRHIQKIESYAKYIKYIDKEKFINKFYP